MSKICNPKDHKATNPGYICNPNSGRWIKADGAVAKKLALAKKSSPVQAHVAAQTTALSNACEGKTKAQGGLNVDGLYKLAKQKKYSGPKSRASLIKFLCVKKSGLLAAPIKVKKSPLPGPTSPSTHALPKSASDPNNVNLVCPTTKFSGAPNYLEHFDPTDYSINGKPTKITKRVKLAAGTEGTVYRLELTTDDGNKAILAVKIPKPAYLHNFREIEVIQKHQNILKCPGVIPMKIGRFQTSRNLPAVFMPLADGSLRQLGRLTPEQAKNIVNILKNILLCMDKQQMYYFDLKAANIVFNCKDPKNATIYLADMASIIPNEDGDYVATHPPPVDAKGSWKAGSRATEGYVNINKGTGKDSELAQKIYSYQLSLLYIYLITKHEPPAFESDHKTYFKGINDFIRYTVGTIVSLSHANYLIGKDNKYMKVVINMLNDTKNPDTWTLDNIPLLSNL